MFELLGFKFGISRRYIITKLSVGRIKIQFCEIDPYPYVQNTIVINTDPYTSDQFIVLFNKLNRYE